MLISRRSAAVTSVRTLGVVSAAAAIALGTAGTAFACHAGDFTPTVACDAASGQAQITVTDSDNQAATIQVYLVVGGQSQQVGSTEQIPASQNNQPRSTVVDVPWQTTQPWTVQATVSGFKPFEITLAAPSGSCGTPSGSPSSSPSKSTKPTPPASTPTSPSSSASASAPASASASASAVSSASASPTGGTLATTGGGSDSGLLAGLGAALVAVGGGAVFAMRRRTAGRH